MEDVRPLVATCKHLRSEARDETVARLCRQKHAAHTRIYRLRQKLKELELTTRLLTACWVSATRHNETINERVSEIVEKLHQDLPE